MTTQETIDQAASVLWDALDAADPSGYTDSELGTIDVREVDMRVVARALADAGLLVSDAKDVMYLNHKLTEARDTIQRLNRRAQVAEAAINELANGTGNGKCNRTAREIWERCQENHDRYHDWSCDMAVRQREEQARHVRTLKFLWSAVKRRADERDTARAKIQRVRDLHQPHPDDCSCHARRWDGSCFYAGTCNSCHCGMPCPTIRALDQEEQP